MNRPLAKLENKSAGFTILELVVAVAILLIVSAIAVPQATAMLRSYRLSGAARGLLHQVSLARLRAASEFNEAQIVLNPAANSYSLQVCTVAGKADNCTAAGDYNNEGTQFLPQGMSFGFGPASVAAGGQAPMQQTLQVRFNSRGIPILLDGTGAINANDVIYLTDNQGHAYAVSVTVGGHPRVWMYNAGGWQRQ